MARNSVERFPYLVALPAYVDVFYRLEKHLFRQYRDAEFTVRNFFRLRTNYYIGRQKYVCRSRADVGESVA